MMNILVRYYSPEELGIEEPLTFKLALDKLFHVTIYANDFDALTAYAETPATWSVLLDDSRLKDNAKGVTEFLNEAYKAIENNDFEWLEQFFT